MRLWVILLAILIGLGCTFSKEEYLLATHNLANGIKVGVYFTAVGATAQDNIQVRSLSNNKRIAVFEKYNFLKESFVLDDSTLQLILCDTGYSRIYVCDTINVIVR